MDVDVQTANAQESMVETQFSSERTAVMPDEPSEGSGGLEAMRTQLTELLESPAAERIFAPIEKNVSITRLQMAYGAMALVGLYLIFGSAAQLICNLIGFGYPAYVSLKAVRSKTPIAAQWAIYWTMFATFSLVDFFADGIMHVFPIYYLLKASCLIYLYLPQTNGAALAYYRYVEPAMLKLENVIRDYLTQKRA